MELYKLLLNELYLILTIVVRNILSLRMQRA